MRISDTYLVLVPGALAMAACIKDEPGCEDEETIMSRITIKNEPGTSVLSGDEATATVEHEHNVILGSCSLAVGCTFKTGHPLISHTLTRSKNEITVKDEYMQDETFNDFTNNSSEKCLNAVQDSKRYVSTLWNIDKDSCQVNITKTEQHQGEIKTESDHGMEYDESPLMITDVHTLLPGEDNDRELKSSVSKDKVTPNFVLNHELDSLVNPAKNNNVASLANKAENGNNRIHVEKKRHKCKACGKSFAYKCHLKIHFRLYTGEKAFKCDICKKSFVQKKHLTAHSRIHTGEKPFKCNICDKSFVQKEHLANHNRIHTGEKPYI